MYGVCVINGCDPHWFHAPGLDQHFENTPSSLVMIQHFWEAQVGFAMSTTMRLGSISPPHPQLRVGISDAPALRYRLDFGERAISNRYSAVFLDLSTAAFIIKPIRWNV